MPTGFGGSFTAYAEGKSAHPGATRFKTLSGCVKNLAKLRKECEQKIRSSMPSHYHFEESDIAIIKIQAFNEGLSELRTIAEEQKSLERQPEEILKQKDLIAQQKALIAQQRALLAPQYQELALQQQELALQKQEFAKQQQDLTQQKTLLAQQQQEHKQQQKQFDEKQQSHQNGEVPEPDIFQDKIFTLDVMEEPVIATDGFTYEKRCILEWFRTKRTSPMTGAVLSSTQLIPNCSLKSHIHHWRDQQPKKVVDTKDKTATVATVATVAKGELDFLFRV